MHQAFFCSFILTLMGIQFMEADPQSETLKTSGIINFHMDVLCLQQNMTSLHYSNSSNKIKTHGFNTLAGQGQLISTFSFSPHDNSLAPRKGMDKQFWHLTGSHKPAALGLCKINKMASLVGLWFISPENGFGSALLTKRVKEELRE